MGFMHTTRESLRVSLCPAQACQTLRIWLIGRPLSIPSFCMPHQVTPYSTIPGTSRSNLEDLVDGPPVHKVLDQHQLVHIRVRRPREVHVRIALEVLAETVEGRLVDTKEGEL
jgi:hypothetical protein